MTFNTWEELYKHFGFYDEHCGTFDLRDRFDLTEEEEREFVSACYDLYEKHGFTDVFYQDTFPAPDFHGGKFEVIGRCTEETHDLETLPMWKIRFLEDGFEWEGFPEEICKDEIFEETLPSVKNYCKKDVDKMDIVVYDSEITQEQIKKAEQCLIDNGIDENEACTVLQALGYILLDAEFYPEDC